MITPGKNVVCIQAVGCPCGCVKATKGAAYMCVDVGYRSFMHAMFCRTDGCDGTLIILEGKEHCLCACCFAPLDDGDTSLVDGEKDVTEEAPNGDQPVTVPRETEDA